MDIEPENGFVRLFARGGYIQPILRTSNFIFSIVEKN
jgi:hypothetical protein